ncbi:MAG TPA: SPOR domain-containing protein [Acidobacteriota bacterium]|nr:SPOR domain-containing protein [Acidobacteriota bacterium]
MKHVSVSLLVLLALCRMDVSARDIYTLIREGNLREAADSLSAHSSAELRDGRLLFFQSLLERDGAESARLMEAALNASVPARFQEEIYYRLVQYYLLTGDVQRLSVLVSEYRARWETGRYDDQMLRFTVLANQLAGDYDTALREADRYLLRYSEGERYQWGRVDKARVLWANDKAIGAAKMLGPVARAKSGPGVPQALYLLAMDAVRRTRTDDAVFYYNLLREGYHGAVGLDDLVDQLGSMPDESSENTRAEEITGTFYSVQVGVFSSRSNAGKHAGTFEAYDKKIDIGSKTISGKKYHVVYVGRFKTFEDARRFKEQIELTHGEAYQVVAR